MILQSRFRTVTAALMTGSALTLAATVASAQDESDQDRRA